VFVFRLSDKFGDMGIVCYVVVDISAAKSGGEAVITDFVMSCRAMGRTLEFFAYQYVLMQLKNSGIDAPPKVDFSPSAKNRPFAEFLEKLTQGRLETYCMEKDVRQ
jgi:predicted enzyme involved in methoxymalonyl-ACP biosynthesis